MRRSVSAVVALAGWVAAGPSASAMTFSAVPLDDGTTALMASGRILPGDDRKLHQLVTGLPTTTRLVAVVLDSPGGDLREGVFLATNIHSTRLPTMVGPDGTCASACFLMFAGGSSRIVTTTSRVGVHSASSLTGEDDAMAQAVTTLMARKAAELGVPPGIIGTMVTTPPSSMAWLTRQDYNAMHVTVIEAADSYTPGSALTPGGSRPPSRPDFPLLSNQPPPTGDASLARPEPITDPAYLAGRTDRLSYERWYAALEGSVLDGARWWAANRSQATRQHLSCQTAPFAADADFLAGCLQAQAALATSDKRRRGEPLYKAGWNSL